MIGSIALVHSQFVSTSATAISLIYTLYSSPLHKLGFSVFISHILATDFDTVIIRVSL
jgi:hypothetical protein